jgi:hypothetical protein
VGGRRHGSSAAGERPKQEDMTLASLFRSAPAVPPGGRHAAPDTGEDDPMAAVPDARPGRHAAPEDDAATEESGDLLEALGFGYGD